MSSAAWKALERRICARMGGRRAGPLGAAVSDCVNVPFAMEIKRSIRQGPPVLSTWVLQAKLQSKREGKPWLVVVAGHNDRRPIATLDFELLAQILEQAGWIAKPGQEQGEPADFEPQRRHPPEGLSMSETEWREPDTVEPDEAPAETEPDENEPEAPATEPDE